VLAALALSALLGFGGPLTPANPVALAARNVNINDRANLYYYEESESEDFEDAGQATGTLPGSVKASINVGADVRISFTLRPHGGGSISGHSTATIHGKGTYISFVGPVQITRGTGSWAHVRGQATVYGTFNRQTLNSTVEVIGKLQH
jgi:hypothetical protein